MEPNSEPKDFLEELRGLLHIPTTGQTQAGPISAGTWEEYAAAYEAEMKQLHQAGYDYSGLGDYRSGRQ